MKYKVGDKVKLKSKEGLDELERLVGDLYIHPDAYKNAGSEQTILICNDGFYRYDASSMFWHESLFEGLVEDTDERLLKRAADAFKKVDEMMEARYQKNKTYYSGEQWSTEFECPEGYIFKDENGNVINATKIVLEKKKGLTQERINAMVHDSCVSFCEHCGCGVPRDTCTSLGTCDEHDEYKKHIRSYLMEKEYGRM